VPRLLDLEIGTGWLVLRIVAGVLLSAVVFFFLSYVPSNLPLLISKFMPPDLPDAVGQIVSSLIHPFLPFLGAIVSASVFLEVLFRKTKAYGPALIFAGLASTLYVYFAFQGGIITVVIPREFTMGVQVVASLDITLIMVLCMLPTLLTVLRGAVMSFSRKR
jgi:hypothetical protein